MGNNQLKPVKNVPFPRILCNVRALGTGKKFIGVLEIAGSPKIGIFS